MNRSEETAFLEDRIIAGDDVQAIGELVRKYQDRLEHIVAFRMEPALRARLDPADVLQEALVEATQRIDDFRALGGSMPFFLWLRFITLQKLNQMRRFHLATQARAVGRELSLDQGGGEPATSAILAAGLAGDLTSPSQAADRHERHRLLEAAMEELDETDRETLALRHFEQLGNSEVARLLNLSESAASNRYVRALRRLKGILDRLQYPS